VRNILSQEHHLDLKAIKWVTFEDAHLAEYKEPAFVTRATGAKKLLPMLMDGEIDAAILGNDLPDDPKIKAVIPNAAAAGRAWHEATGLLPINHMLVVKNELINTHPALVREIYRCFVDAKNSGKNSGTLDMRPIGFEAITPSLELVVELAYQQEMIPQRYKVADLFAPARALLDL
jgi:4,5-dihydroxyphthalate decarboxylase